MATRQFSIRKLRVIVALLALVGLFTCCNHGKSDNVKPFEFHGEGDGRPENFDKDTVVTPENIDSLYRRFTVRALFDGDYYLIQSKKSDTTSRYLSRLIRMSGGKQIAAETFYDSEIDANAVIRLKNRLIVGLNSLRENNHDSIKTTHRCRILVLSDSLKPIAGEIFYSQKGHTYIESLMQNTDSTFFCSVASGDTISPNARYQFRARYDLNIESQTAYSKDPEYEIKSVASPPRIPKDFVLVPAGTLKNAKEWSYQRQRYIHYDLNIDSFYICKYELIQQEYKKVIGHIDKANYTFDTGYYNEETKYVRGDNYPVWGTYKEFVIYCNEKSKKDGYDGFYEISGNTITIKKDGNGYRLLNLFEWTFAAKGGNANENFRYVGSDTLSLVGWYGRNSGNQPHIVGQLRSNSLGLYDMPGNAGEMLESTYSKDFHYFAGHKYIDWILDNDDFGANDIYWGWEKDGTRIALVTKGMKNRNLDLKYRTKH